MASRPAVLIHNPASGRRTVTRALPQILDVLHAGGFDVEPLATRGPGDATHLAHERARAGQVEVVFALGGDGTLREAAKGLLGTSVALGPLPAGTSNVLAYAFDLPRRPLPAARALATGKTIEMDVGLAGDEPFLMMISAGVDARVMSRQGSPLKRYLGPAGVALAGVVPWWTYGYPEIELLRNGESLRVPFFALCNIPHYAGPFRLAPEARYDDGRLDLVCQRSRGRWAALGFGLAMARGVHSRRPDVDMEQVEEIEILGPLPEGLQIDGDVIDVISPLRVGLGPDRLRVLVPR